MKRKPVFLQEENDSLLNLVKVPLYGHILKGLIPFTHFPSCSTFHLSLTLETLLTQKYLLIRYKITRTLAPFYPVQMYMLKSMFVCSSKICTWLINMLRLFLTELAFVNIFKTFLLYCYLTYIRRNFAHIRLVVII